MASLYRISLPFIGILIIGLLMIMYIPGLSTIAVAGDIQRSKDKSAEVNEPPREAWLMECVQEDRNNPLPCTDEDRQKWGSGKDIAAGEPENTTPDPAASGEPPSTDDDAGMEEDDDLLNEMMGDSDGGADKDDETPDDEKKKPEDSETDDDLLNEMLKE